MTSAIEFSYLNTGFSLYIDENVLSRAVRVKNVVKDKIKRVFDNSVIGEVKQDTAEPVEKTSLLDLNVETLQVIASKLEDMQKQENVPCVSNRAVLFTSALVLKIRSVTDKWYPYKQDLQVENNAFNNELNSINITNSLGGEVVPGSWNVALENVSEEENDTNFVPTIEQEFVPTAQTSESYESELEMPSLEIENNLENENNTVEPIQAPVVEYSTDDSDIYSFMPNMDDLIPSVMPTVSNINSEVNDEEVVPEPQDLNVVNEEDFVPEPTFISANENVSDAVENELPEEVTTDKVENNEPETNVKPSVLSIEDRIAQLLQRKNVSSPKSVSEITQNVEIDKEKTNDNVEGKSEFTSTHVMARLRRVLNEMADKDETIKKLSSKNKTMSEEMSQAKDKIRGYEAVVSDLTAKNDSLLKENEKLSAKVHEVQTSSQATISKLEAQVEDLNKSKSEENESTRGIIAELKARHAEELAEMRERHAKELRSVNDSKDRQIQAIYATISDVLGDSSIDDNYGKSFAA